MAFGFSVGTPARGELAYETGQRGPFQKDQVAVPGPGAYHSSTAHRTSPGAPFGGGLMRSASERSFVESFAARPDLAASRKADSFNRLATCGTPHSLAARRSVLRTERDPNWITSPTPLTKDAAEITLGRSPPPTARESSIRAQSSSNFSSRCARSRAFLVACDPPCGARKRLTTPQALVASSHSHLAPVRPPPTPPCRYARAREPQRAGRDRL